MTRNDPVETVESDTDDGSELDECNDGECDAGNSSDEEDNDDPTGQCDIGDLIKLTQWNFEDMDENFVDDSAPAHYDGPSGNRPGVNRRFTDPFECLRECHTPAK